MKKLIALFLLAAVLLLPACAKEAVQANAPTITPTTTEAPVAEVPCEIVDVVWHFGDIPGTKSNIGKQMPAMVQGYIEMPSNVQVIATLKNTGDKDIQTVTWYYGVFDEEKYLIEKSTSFDCHGFDHKLKLKPNEIFESTVEKMRIKDDVPAYLTACIKTVQYFMTEPIGTIQSIKTGNVTKDTVRESLSKFLRPSFPLRRLALIGGAVFIASNRRTFARHYNQLKEPFL